MTAVYGDACMDFSTVRRWERTLEVDNPATMNMHDHACSQQLIITKDTRHQANMEELICANVLCQAERSP